MMLNEFDGCHSRSSSKLNSEEPCPDKASDKGPGVQDIGLQDQLLDGSTDCIFVLGPDWRFRYLNPAADLEISQGRSLVGEGLWETFPEARSAAFEDEYRRAMDHRVPVKFEAYFEPLKSWYEVKASPLSGGGIGVWFTNVTERKANERALAAVEERYRFAAAATNDLIWDWDLATDKVLWIESAGGRLGYE
ncbi:MAG: PAS domain-containing protein, partial [Candidatus Binatia bacterium]